MNRGRIPGCRRSALIATLVGLLGAAGATFCVAADAAPSSILVEVRGTVKASPESVAFKGPVQIESRTVTDANFGAVPNVELSIDMSAVVGLGLSSGNKYVTQSREVISVPLRADGNGEIAIDFPYEASSAKGFSAFGVGQASFKLHFVLPSGDLAIGQGRIDTPGVLGVAGK